MDSIAVDMADIAGISIHPLRDITDARGSVLHMLRADAPHFKAFGEIYFSEVLPGAVKAWKFHHEMTQHFAVPVGRIKLVVYDDRLQSPTRGRLAVYEIGRPDTYRLVVVPPRLWYGFASIGGATAILANCADLPHTTGESERLDLHDAVGRIPYAWI